MTKPSVGILSMQRVINYGSFLQAYALKQLLKDNGAGEVYFVDIIPGRILVDNPTSNKNKWVRYAKKLCQLVKNGKLISGIKTFFFQKKIKKSIISAWPQLGLENKPAYPLDLIVIGSDEVFNCYQDVPWGYSTQLFGDIPKTVARKTVSYAGSFGYTDIEKLKVYDIESEVAECFKKLESISVRDENSASIVARLINRNPSIHIDPVLAYGYKKEIESFTTSPYAKSYMVVYSYQGRINDKNEINAIWNYAKQKSLQLISIFCRYDWCDKSVVPCTPIEVLRWFKYAESIVTDTFHGTIFSIITESNFATLIRPSNQNKLSYLLNSLELIDRVATPSMITNILSTSPNYHDCNSVIYEKRHETDQYLTNQLQGLF